MNACVLDATVAGQHQPWANLSVRSRRADPTRTIYDSVRRDFIRGSLGERRQGCQCRAGEAAPDFRQSRVSVVSVA
jgi:hypothetical protein